MFFIGSDFTEGDGADATFAARMKSGGNGKVLVEVYCTSGMVAATPYRLDYVYTTESAGAMWLQPRTFATNPARSLIGVASDAVASGCNGWIQIRGQIASVSFAVASQTGSMGHAVFYTDSSGLGASSSAYLGAMHQCGFLIEEATATLAINIFLTGNEKCEAL